MIAFGGGYEGFLHKGFGLGFDIGVGSPLSDSASGLAGILTLNAIYDFQRTANQKFCPFVAGGLTALMPNDAGGGFNVGGGVKYWFAKHAGLRIDFRFHARPGRLHTYQDVQARIGIAFR